MGRRRRSGGDGLAFFSVLIVIGVGLSLAIAWTIGMISPRVGGVAMDIAFIIMTIALIVPVILSFRARKDRGIVWFILWIIALIMIIVFGILMFGLGRWF
ncbi:MAG: hypothetical protein FWC02_02845 [Firmicutes bacterium]|nr:hypothetical protein [Bacillota bacterium]